MTTVTQRHLKATKANYYFVDISTHFNHRVVAPFAPLHPQRSAAGHLPSLPSQPGLPFKHKPDAGSYHCITKGWSGPFGVTSYQMHLLLDVYASFSLFQVTGYQMHLLLDVYSTVLACLK